MTALTWREYLRLILKSYESLLQILEIETLINVSDNRTYS